MVMSVLTASRSSSIPFLGLVHPARPLEFERLGDDAHRQHARFFRDARDDGRGARARAAAHACGDEHHLEASA